MALNDFKNITLNVFINPGEVQIFYEMFTFFRAKWLEKRDI